MEENEKISVIIPTYNRKDSIVQSIESVLNQTYKNIEVIVVDDCSNDNTIEQIKKITDKRLNFYQLDKNYGACYARNYGIKKATGRYIAFNDSDDIFIEDKLEIQMNNMKKEKSDLDFCKMKVMENSLEWLFPSNEQEERIAKHGILNELCNGNIISTQTILAKKDIFDSILFDNSLRRFQDYDLVLRIAIKFKISYTQKILVNAYRKSDSISNSDERLISSCILMLKKDYGLDRLQEETLCKTLKDWLFYPHNRKYEEIKKNYELLETECIKLKKDVDDYETLKSNYDELKSNFDSIVNSKRWQIVNKILHIFRK